RLEREESRLATRGNPQKRFARKTHSKGQKPAKSITLARPVIQPIQWLLKSLRTTISVFCPWLSVFFDLDNVFTSQPALPTMCFRPYGQVPVLDRDGKGP